MADSEPQVQEASQSTNSTGSSYKRATVSLSPEAQNYYSQINPNIVRLLEETGTAITNIVRFVAESN